MLVRELVKSHELKGKLRGEKQCEEQVPDLLLGAKTNPVEEQERLLDETEHKKANPSPDRLGSSYGHCKS
jgi:hypothetical protein